ncbi:MAG: thioredoxin domain-containing protein [Planctomycetota bacterium]
MKRNIIMAGMALLFLSVAAWAGEKQEEQKPLVVAEKYPSLTSGALYKVKLAELADGVLLKAEGVELKAESVDEELKQAPEDIRKQLEKNKFFLLENMATEQLLLLAARNAGKVTEGADTLSAIRAYLQNAASKVEVSDEDAKAFYDENKSMLGGMPFEQVKPQIKQYMAQQKQQDAVEEHIRTLGDRMEIRVNRAWTEAQAKLTMDNPVDKARAGGKPTMVEFGAHGCGPCDMMTPILEDMAKKYADKANILFVPVQEEQILAARYGIRSIPVQVFFDTTGKEIFRHGGFFPQEECEKWLNKAGGK